MYRRLWIYSFSENTIIVYRVYCFYDNLHLDFLLIWFHSLYIKSSRKDFPYSSSTPCLSLVVYFLCMRSCTKKRLPMQPNLRCISFSQRTNTLGQQKRNAGIKNFCNGWQCLKWYHLALPATVTTYLARRLTNRFC